MRRLFDLGFFIAIALACVGLDFYILKWDRGDQVFGLAQYIALRKEDVQDLIAPPSLAAALPSDIEGWDMHPKGADQILPGPADSRAQQASEIALVKAVAALEKASHPAGDMVGTTMTKGDTRLRVMVVLVAPQETIAGIETKLADPATLDPVLHSMLQQKPVQQGDAPYSVVDGVAFAELSAAAAAGDDSPRMMRATLGRDLSVTVVTKSTDDAAIREALQAIDFVMLNKLLQKPVPGVVEGRITDLRLDPANAADPAQSQPLPAPQTTTAAPVASLGAANDPAIASAALAAADLAADPAAKPKIAPAETAVFVAPPSEMADSTGQPCVRRSGILVCPDG